MPHPGSTVELALVVGGSQPTGHACQGSDSCSWESCPRGHEHGRVSFYHLPSAALGRVGPASHPDSTGDLWGIQVSLPKTECRRAGSATCLLRGGLGMGPLCPLCPLLPVGVRRASPRVRRMSELSLSLTSCSTIESGSCTSSEKLSRAGPAVESAEESAVR